MDEAQMAGAAPPSEKRVLQESRKHSIRRLGRTNEPSMDRRYIDRQAGERRGILMVISRNQGETDFGLLVSVTRGLLDEIEKLRSVIEAQGRLLNGLMDGLSEEAFKKGTD